MSRSFLNLGNSLSLIDVLVISGLSVAHVNSALAACDDSLKIPLDDSNKKALVELLATNDLGLGKGFSLVEKVPFDICKDAFALEIQNNNKGIVVKRDIRNKSSVNFIVTNNSGFKFFLEVDDKKYELKNRRDELTLQIKSKSCGEERLVINSNGEKTKKMEFCSHNDHFSHYSSSK